MMRVARRPRIALVGAAAALGLAIGTTAEVRADLIPVMNAGFENLVLSGPGDFSLFNIPDWTTSGRTATFYPDTETEYPGGAPEGHNVAAVGDGEGAGMISQVLLATVQADTSYTLMVDVGHRSDFPFSSYTIALVANGVTLASDSSLRPAAVLEPIPVGLCGSWGMPRRSHSWANA